MTAPEDAQQLVSKIAGNDPEIASELLTLLDAIRNDTGHTTEREEDGIEDENTRFLSG